MDDGDDDTMMVGEREARTEGPVVGSCGRIACSCSTTNVSTGAACCSACCGCAACCCDDVDPSPLFWIIIMCMCCELLPPLIFPDNV